MTVLIYPNFSKENALECTLQVCDYFYKNGVNVKMLNRFSVSISLPYINFCETCDVADCEVVVSVGGDGTILECARLCYEYDKELLGINCGRLGFMATLEKDELDKLSDLICGRYKVESRMVLDAVIERDSGDNEVYNALNDVVVYSGIMGKINDFTVIADGTVVSSLRADGLIFSTPTGSSAYSLSAGGPLIEPSFDCIEFTQICPHSLFARSMIFSPEKLLRVEYEANNVEHICLSIDGSEAIPLNINDSLYIRRSDMRIKLIDISGNSYFRAVGTKLMQPTKDIKR